VPRRTWLRWLRAGALALFALLVLGVAYGAFVGWSLTHLKRTSIPTSPAFWGMPYRAVRFASVDDHLRLRGWWIPAAGAHLTVIFSHGFGSNRADIGVPGLLMMRAVHEWGANILTFDYRAEGRSPGKLVSVGEFEIRDLLGAVRAAQSRFAPGDPIAIVGYSMGASIALLAGEQDQSVAAVVADSPFADLQTYLQHNLQVWTQLPAFPFNALVLWLVPGLTGVDPARVDPMAHLAAFGHRPVLLIAGTADKTIPDRNSRTLYAGLRRSDPHASLWIVKGAEHVESFQLRPLAYLQRLFGVLHRVDPELRAPPGWGL